MVSSRLAAMIISTSADRPIRVAIDGIDAAGKTTLANALVEPLTGFGREVIRASIDGFHHPTCIRYRRGADSPLGYYYDSFNYEALVRCLLEPLGPSGNRVYHMGAFDYINDREQLSDRMMASENAILVFDGVFLFRPQIDSYWDFRIYVDVSMEVAIERAIMRDARRMGGEAETRRRYETRYYPGQQIYIRECNPPSRADAVILNDDPTAPILIAKENGCSLDNR
jgi:uridine kinase